MMERYETDNRYRVHYLYVTNQPQQPHVQPRRHWLDVLVGSPVYVAFGMLCAIFFLWFIGGR
jgi:hypothetical protein